MTARTRSFQRHQKTTATPTATHVYAPFSTIITQFICIFGNFHIKFQSTATHPILIAQQRNQHQNDRRITIFPTLPTNPRHPHCHARHHAIHPFHRVFIPFFRIEFNTLPHIQYLSHGDDIGTKMTARTRSFQRHPKLPATPTATHATTP
jgi:hypothetical protein